MERKINGQLNDTYRIIGQIGAGGGGIVYKVYHERLKIVVVAKQVRDEGVGKAEGEAEANILKRLKHMYLPRIYDFLEIDGKTYTIMDFIPGESLRESLTKQKRFSQKQVLKWAIQLAQALDYLHSQNPPIIHSDIKPGNVMLTPSGDICLIDFNISLAFDMERAKSTGFSGGYAPPEQYHNLPMYRGLVAKQNASTGTTESLTGSASARTTVTEVVESVVGRGVDERSDVYSLGATLYHLLTGVKPDIDFERIVPISSFAIGVSEGLSLIIGKMMSPDPAQRYRNGGEVLYALEHVYEMDSDYQTYRRRKWVWRVVIAGLYVAGGVLIGTGLMQLRRETTTAYNRSVEQAEELLEKGRYEDASEEISRAMALIPDRIDAYVKELYRLYSMGEYECAVRYGRDAINNPSYRVETDGDTLLLGDLYYLLGNAYLEQDDNRNAENCLEEAMHCNRENSLYVRDYAIVLAKTGNVDQAEETLEDAIALGLGEDSIYMAQGEIASTKGEYDRAVACLTEAIRVASDSDLFRRAVILCAQCYEHLGDEGLEGEIALLEEAENQFPQGVPMHMTELLANAYARRAKSSGEEAQVWYGKALSEFTELYEKGYSSRQMMENIAVLYQEMEAMDEATEMLREIIRLYPEDYRAYKRLAFLEADLQQKKENPERDYTAMKQYYDEAVSLYAESGEDSDAEMQMLDRMMRDLEEGGWF